MEQVNKEQLQEAKDLAEALLIKLQALRSQQTAFIKKQGFSCLA